jgi:hypothetical protein
VGGNIIKWFGTCAGITADKQLEEELRRANERVYLAVRGSDQSIWEADMPDGILENSRSASRSATIPWARRPTLPGCFPS